MLHLVCCKNSLLQLICLKQFVFNLLVTFEEILAILLVTVLVDNGTVSNLFKMAFLFLKCANCFLALLMYAPSVKDFLLLAISWFSRKARKVYAYCNQILNALVDITNGMCYNTSPKLQLKVSFYIRFFIIDKLFFENRIYWKSI